MLFFYVSTRLHLRTPVFAYLIFTHYLFLLSVLGHRRWYFVLTWSVHYDLINNITYLYPCCRRSVPPRSVDLPRIEVRICTRYLIPVPQNGFIYPWKCSVFEQFNQYTWEWPTHLVICIVYLFIFVPCLLILILNIKDQGKIKLHNFHFVMI